MKRRDNIRAMHAVCMAGVEVLMKEAFVIESVDTRDRLIVQYYSNSLVYCLNEEQVEQLKNKLDESLHPYGLDISQMVEDECLFGVVGQPVWKQHRRAKTVKKNEEPEIKGEE